MVPRRMAKSSVERYEQLLAQDPASAVFVELAKALISKGEHARVIAVCEQGILHHPQSVTGRVLWGKALILMGRPAEAMSQFDQAVALDKENAHAYNLISEVLLQRGLYRSALPILRKALALQPNDARVRGWMEQAQAALAGGPAPAFEDLNSLEKPAPEDGAPEGTAVDAPPAPPAEAAAAPVPAEPEPEPVEVLTAEPLGAEAARPATLSLDALPEVALPFDDEDDVVRAANDSIYGLAAGIWTKDVSKAHRTAAAVKAGSVWVNQYNGFDTALPFGGFKQSGNGRELGPTGLAEYQEHKHVYQNLSPAAWDQFGLQ